MANGTPDSASLLASSASASPRPSAERLLTQESAEDRLEAVGPLDVGQVLAVGDEFERSFFEARDRLFRLRVGKYPIAHPTRRVSVFAGEGADPSTPRAVLRGRPRQPDEEDKEV